jgi:hypothetical protein
VSRHPWNRLLAWLLDWACILGWVAITAAIGIPLFLSGVTVGLSAGILNLVAALVIVVPVTCGQALLESSSREASVGKRARRLMVVNISSGERVSFARALSRNALKIKLPWLIGHAAVFALVLSNPSTAGVSPGVWLLTVAAYVLPIAYVVSLFIGTGRMPYDRIAGTFVMKGVR